MSSRFPSHQLNNGLYVSGRPEPPKEKAPTMSSTAVPYTGGDIKKSGELGKMFEGSRKSGQLTSGPLRTGSMSVGNATHSGQISSHSFFRNFPKIVFWSMVLLFVMGFISAIFILAAVGNPILLIVVVVLFGIVSLAFAWNVYRSRSAVIKFISEYPDAELRTAKDGQFVKVSGVVTCGNVPLESSFQRVPRCVYTSTSLYEYRGWDSKAANPTHQRFTWGLRSMERHVVDFYISDFQSGLRALVKTGYGARVTPYVEESAVIDINQSNKDMSPQFLRWLADRNLSSDDRMMRLKEGYIKEGSSVSVMGVVQRNDNVLMIVPPPEPVPTGCQWATCMLPASLDGIVLRCDDSSNPDVIPV
ncbi:putative uncharacterized membrane protein [Helianthus annuus]|nr:putative uncharacterized membrane protein [Helianthus annuus]KAJ0607090.1 putative uncharacterized membrane protein [Helianthus annuus]KAJ0767143.1 putative uncharacterized membrane protein [Helianthus annuus]KAJ0772996.1 putative uncharacterized membrane protein [Helianthus annuus]